jgi:hypothetical protein
MKRHDQIEGQIKINQLKSLLARKTDTSPIPFHWPHGGKFKSEMHVDHRPAVVDDESNSDDEDEDDLICRVQLGLCK